MTKKFSNSFSKNITAGFTLIELLVVIAIIGILSSVVLASLNIARMKGIDASVRANLDNVRVEASLYYDANSQYATVDFTQAVCPSVSAVGNLFSEDLTILNAINRAVANSGGTSSCVATASAYAVAVSLKSGGSWCIDNTGSARSSLGTPDMAIALGVCI